MTTTKPTSLRCALFATALLAPISVWAADAKHGETLAKRWCAGCHLVGPDQSSATTDAPPFAFIAKKPDFDEAKVAFFLLDPHPKMPNMQLTRDDATDLAAYIATLGPRRAPPQENPPIRSRRAESSPQPAAVQR